MIVGNMVIHRIIVEAVLFGILVILLLYITRSK